LFSRNYENGFSSWCPISVTDAVYTCRRTVDFTPGFYTAALVYEPPGGTNLDAVVAGTTDFLLAPPLVPSTTTLTAPSPVTASGGTLVATITHAPDLNYPDDTVDFSEGSQTLCAH